jgi:hypothetical protein
MILGLNYTSKILNICALTENLRMNQLVRNM